ncbi:farnesyl-diphosphate synthase [Clostridia bacterium]|nr:farnesyl-diphosphate synthase [Clostridia bacterium]
MNKYKEIIERELNKIEFPVYGNEYAGALLSAVHHSLLNGGKRIRPSLTLAVHDAVAGTLGAEAANGIVAETTETMIPFATAIEMLHTFSLIYDDLPAFDDDDMRRGRPSCHKKYGESTAILAGTILTTVPFAQIASCGAGEQCRLNGITLLANAVNEMTYGQYLDKFYETDPPIEHGDVAHIADTHKLPELESQILDMYKLKTGAMMKTACLLGVADIATPEDIAIAMKYSVYGKCEAVAATADTAGWLTRKAILAIAEYGERVGLLFQLVDDILDVVGDAEILGKPVGSDVKNGKNTILRYRTINDVTIIARREAEKAAQAIHRAFGNRADTLANYAYDCVSRVT